MDTTGLPEIKDFSLPTKSRPFKIEDDVYHAVPGIPLQLMASMKKFSNLKNLAESDDALESLLSVFDELLQNESALLFRKRTAEKVITVDHLKPLMEWLMEGYGARPTEPSSDSSEASTTVDGTSSTDGASPEDSTYSDLIPVDR